LDAAPVAERILAEARAMESDRTWSLRCMTVMPDHLHLLVVLRERLSLARAVQRLKARTSTALRSGAMRWERGFFDRRLRRGDHELDVFLYVYLNPYRGLLITPDRQWAYYYCKLEDWCWFRELLQDERPVPEWLR
jgi:REP element-mobilizing transposase RayT